MLQEKLKFMSENSSCVDEYKIRDAYSYAVHKVASKKLNMGLSFYDEKISQEDTPEVAVQKIIDRHQKIVDEHFGGNWDLYKNTKKLKYSFESLNGLEYTKDGFELRTLRNKDYPSLFYLFRFMNSGEVDVDLAESWKIVEKYQFDGRVYIEELSISLQIFKNGKIIVKGVGSESMSRLHFYKELFDKKKIFI